MTAAVLVFVDLAAGQLEEKELGALNGSSAPR